MKAKRLRIWFNRILGTIAVLFLILFMFSLGVVAYYSTFNVNNTLQMSFYKFESDQDSLQLKVEHEWIPLDSISRNMVVAVLAAQDKNFYVHDGFALIDERDSLDSHIPNVDETITQRMAHAVFLREGKILLERPLENYYTIVSEYMWGKDRILEVYLNSTLTGDGIFGVEAASRIYFGKPAGDLTKDEAAFIAAVMDNPRSANIVNPSEELLARQKSILKKMALIFHIKVGKKPIDEKTDSAPRKPVYKREWRG